MDTNEDGKIETIHRVAGNDKKNNSDKLESNNEKEINEDSGEDINKKDSNDTNDTAHLKENKGDSDNDFEGTDCVMEDKSKKEKCHHKGNDSNIGEGVLKEEDNNNKEEEKNDEEIQDKEVQDQKDDEKSDYEGSDDDDSTDDGDDDNDSNYYDSSDDRKRKAKSDKKESKVSDDDTESEVSVVEVIAETIDDNDESDNNLALKRERDPLLMEGLTNQFDSFEGAKKCIYRYIKDTGIQLSIRTSKPYRSCIFVCSTHEDCPFKLRVSKKWKKMKWTVVAEELHHSTVERKTKDGRKIRKRQYHRADSLNQVSQCKSSEPTAADVQKTSSSVYNESLTYHQASRVVRAENATSLALEKLNYQRIIPYI